METTNFHSNYVSGMRIEESLGKYRLSCKVGAYCTFGIDQLSNQLHYHDSFELCIVTSGTGKFILNDTTHNISKGDLIIADMQIPHEIQSNDTNGMQLLYIFISIRTNTDVTLTKSTEDQILEDFLRQHNAHIPSQFQLISYLEFVESYNNRRGNQNPGTYNALKNLILESLSLLSCKSDTGNKKIISKNVIEMALDYIDLNLENKILIKDVAHHSYTSQRNLEHLFRKHLGKTVIGYINDKKMDLACHYLAMHFTIADTGRLLGMPDAAQFSRLFKKHKDMSPSKYQSLKAPDKQGIGRRLSCKTTLY